VAGAADVYLTEEGHISLLRRHVVAIADGLATDAEGS
jgi:hypothetical protein